MGEGEGGSEGRGTDGARVKDTVCMLTVLCGSHLFEKCFFLEQCVVCLGNGVNLVGPLLWCVGQVLLTGDILRPFGNPGSLESLHMCDFETH